MRYETEWNEHTAKIGLDFIVGRLWACVVDKHLPVDISGRLFAYGVLFGLEQIIGTDAIEKMLPGWWTYRTDFEGRQPRDV